jgi:hypothetical protein
MIEKALKELWLIEREEQIAPKELTLKDLLELKKMLPEIGEIKNVETNRNK